MAYGDIIEHNGVIYQDIMPNMTGFNTPAPYKLTVSSPHSYNNGVAWKAFDGITSGVSWQGSTATLVMDFGEAVDVDYMELWLCNDQNNRFMTVWGSNDNVNFTKICTVQSHAVTSSIHPEQKIVLPNRINYRYFKFSSEGTSVWFCIGEIRFYQRIDGEQYLLYDGETYQTITDAELAVLENQNITKENFQQYGFQDLQQVKEVYGQLGQSFQLLRFSPVNPNESVKITHLPPPQLILPIEDIDLSAYHQIHQLSLTTTGAAGLVKMVFSFDKGETWQTFSDGAWQQIALSIDTVQASGITPEMLSVISSERWNQAVTGTLRVAYCLSKSAVTDDLAVDTLAITGNVATWRKAQHMVDYDYEYPNPRTLLVHLLADGSYKVNYTV